MASSGSAFVLGLSIITAAAVFVVPPLIVEYKNQNILSTTVGAVRLGKVYDESLRAKVVIKATEDGSVFMAIDEDADNIFDVASKELDKLIESSNESAKSEKEKLTPKDAVLKVHMTVTIETYIRYRSEYQSVYNIVLEKHEITAGVGANISRVLSQVQDYVDQNRKIYAEKHQILKSDKLF